MVADSGGGVKPVRLDDRLARAAAVLLTHGEFLTVQLGAEEWRLREVGRDLALLEQWSGHVMLVPRFVVRLPETTAARLDQIARAQA